MSLLDLLDRPIVYHRVYRSISGKTVAALLLSQLVYWQRIVNNGRGGVNGWFYKTSNEIEEETGLSRHEQVTARKCLIKLKIIETKKEGLPCRLFYRVNLDFLKIKLKEYLMDKCFQPKNNKTNTENEKKEEEERYVQAALKTTDPADPTAYAARIRRRISQQGGLSDADKEQLYNWGEDAMPIPRFRPGDVIVYYPDKKITIKQVYDSGIETDDGYLPIGPLFLDIQKGKARIVR